MTINRAEQPIYRRTSVRRLESSNESDLGKILDPVQEENSFPEKDRNTGQEQQYADVGNPQSDLLEKVVFSNLPGITILSAHTDDIIKKRRIFRKLDVESFEQAFGEKSIVILILLRHENIIDSDYNLLKIPGIMELEQMFLDQGMESKSKEVLSLLVHTPVDGKSLGKFSRKALLDMFSPTETGKLLDQKKMRETLIKYEIITEDDHILRIPSVQEIRSVLHLPTHLSDRVINFFFRWIGNFPRAVQENKLKSFSQKVQAALNILAKKDNELTT